MLWSESVARTVGGEGHAGDPAPSALGKARLSDALIQTFSREVLPGLAAGRASPALSRTALAEHCAARIAAGDAAALSRALADARARGSIPEQLCLTLLTDVARRLGEMWQDDRASFVDVTLGVQMAQRALMDLAPAFAVPAPGLPTGRLLLGGAPGEQHGFGQAMVGEFFRQAGWDVALCPLATAAGWARAAALEHFDVAGISLGRDDGMEELAALIAAVRRASRNRSIAVLVGGPAFLRHAHRAFGIGADATAADAAEAVRQASALLGLPGRAP